MKCKFPKDEVMALSHSWFQKSPRSVRSKCSLSPLRPKKSPGNQFNHFVTFDAKNILLREESFESNGTLLCL